MSTEVETNLLTWESFRAFIVKQQLVTENDIDGIIDETIRNYVINTINQFYVEYENHNMWLDDASSIASIDINSFSEIIDAYLPGFSSIQSDWILSWLTELKKEIKNKERAANWPQVTSDNSEVSPSDQNAQRLESSTPTTRRIEDESLLLLFDMFPDLDQQAVEKVYNRCDKSQEKSIEELLSRHVVSSIDDRNDLTEEERQTLKERTLKRFAEVPVKLEEDGKTVDVCKPVFKWNADKKMVRYYENKVVSTKGEKYFEHKTEEEQELAKQMKSTYINLKPARKYRFH